MLTESKVVKHDMSVKTFVDTHEIEKTIIDMVADFVNFGNLEYKHNLQFVDTLTGDSVIVFENEATQVSVSIHDKRSPVTMNVMRSKFRIVDPRRMSVTEFVIEREPIRSIKITADINGMRIVDISVVDNILMNADISNMLVDAHDSILYIIRLICTPGDEV